MSSMQYVHCPRVWPMNPHLIHNLCTLSYLHLIQTLNPSSNLGMNPAITGSQGSILTFTHMNLIFRCILSSQSTFSNNPISCPILSANSRYWYSKGNPCCGHCIFFSLDLRVGPQKFEKILYFLHEAMEASRLVWHNPFGYQSTRSAILG